jgi:biopolymer transport protein ExbD
MSKVKIAKKSTRIDMTAMCDVAFLLLSFFIMTATAKVPEPKPVDTPQSTVKDKLPEKNLLTITVGDSSVYIGMSDRETRLAALESMSAKYDIEFTDKEKKKFQLIESFGVPMAELKSLLLDENDGKRNKPGAQAGIPYKSKTADIGENEFADWVFFTRDAVVVAQQDKGEKKIKEVSVAIKGNANEKFPVVKKVFDILQKQGVNNFYLVTSLRGEDF